MCEYLNTFKVKQETSKRQQEKEKSGYLRGRNRPPTNYSKAQNPENPE